MPHLSITRLKLKSPFLLVPALVQTEQVVSQLRASAGFLQGELLATLDLALWTATLWTSEQAMRSFYLTGAHRQVMAKLNDWSSEAVAGHQSIAENYLPTWPDMVSRLATIGYFAPLKQPSIHQRNQVIPPPRRILIHRQVTPALSTQPPA